MSWGKNSPCGCSEFGSQTSPESFALRIFPFFDLGSEHLQPGNFSRSRWVRYRSGHPPYHFFVARSDDFMKGFAQKSLFI